jgi:glucosyl-3-phosphoglycerate synthase
VTEASGVRTFDVDDWTMDRVLEVKGTQRVSLCIPCRDEVATIGPLVRMVRSSLIDRYPVVDELIVVDDRSTDESAEVAAQAGAEVVDITKIHETHGVGHGKGNALWASLIASEGDYVVWCDGDVTSVTPSWIAHLLAPLLDDPTVALVKALYHRPTTLGGGGRTTELVARPLLSLYFPELARLEQPLSGEFAGRRDAMESIPFVEGWGVEIAMLVDLARTFGPSCIGQVDLGERHHRHRSLHSLSVQAAEVMATFLSRVSDCPPFGTDGRHLLTRADGSLVPLNLAERPPVSSLL